MRIHRNAFAKEGAPGRHSANITGLAPNTGLLLKLECGCIYRARVPLAGLFMLLEPEWGGEF